MSDSYVTSAAITDGKIELSVRVDDFEPNEYVEISGQATQTSGAFANFYDIQQVPAEANVPPDPNVPGDKEHYYVYVTGTPTPHQFKDDEDVTTVLRVARVWLTVLGNSQKPTTTTAPGPYQPASGGTSWTARKVAKLIGGPWS